MFPTASLFRPEVPSYAPQYQLTSYVPTSFPTYSSNTSSPEQPSSPTNDSQMFHNQRQVELFGTSLTVVTMQAKEYLIGVQIAHFLKRETFNLYRSMKLSGIEIVKCLPDQIEELTQIDAIKRGIHSVTLVPLEPGVLYVAKELKRKPRKKTEKRKPKKIFAELSSPVGSPSHSSSSASASSSPSLSPERELPTSTASAPSAAQPSQRQRTTNHSASLQHLLLEVDDDSTDMEPHNSKLQHWKKLLLVAAVERKQLKTSN